MSARPGERIVAGWIRDNHALHDALDALLEAPGGGPLREVLAFEDGALVLPECAVRDDALVARGQREQRRGREQGGAGSGAAL